MSGSFQLWIDTVQEIAGPTEELSMLDLCCGEMSATRLLPWKSVTAVDVVDYPSRPREYKFIQESVKNIGFPDHSFDVAICSDGLEHFTKSDGQVLICCMAVWAKQPIIFMPTSQPESELEPLSTEPDAHKSSWTIEDFTCLGWATKVFPDWHPTLGWGAMFAWKPKL